MSALNGGITTELRREVTLGRFHDISQEVGGLIRGRLSARHPPIATLRRSLMAGPGRPMGVGNMSVASFSGRHDRKSIPRLAG